MKGGELLVVGLSGPRLMPAEGRLLARLRPGGVILLPRNIADPTQLSELVAGVVRAAPETFLVLDAEGGRVDRLRELVGPAPAGSRLAASPPRFARRSGFWVGMALRLFEFHLDFAPVVDLDRGRRGNALDGRCLGTTPRQAISRARAFLAGLHAAGVGGCLKHFPGLGGAGQDTHHETSRVALPAAELARDLLPFVRLSSASETAMTAHAEYPVWDRDGLPATLSPAIAGRLLRAVVGFRGLLFSDDLEMLALAPWGELPERAALALHAGCDGLLLCHSLEAAPAVAARLARPALDTRRAAARARWQRLRRRLVHLRRKAPAVATWQEIRRALERLDQQLPAE